MTQPPSATRIKKGSTASHPGLTPQWPRDKGETQEPETGECSLAWRPGLGYQPYIRSIYIKQGLWLVVPQCAVVWPRGLG